MPSSHTPAETLYADSTASVRSGPASGRSPTSPPVVSVTLTVDLYPNLRIAEWSEKIKWKIKRSRGRVVSDFGPRGRDSSQTPEWPLSKGEKRENRGKFPGFTLEGGKR
mgnify:FL=1|jgi:hypothetical protein